MSSGLVDPDFRVKYKHLFRKPNYDKSLMSSLKDEISELLKEFNISVDHRFYAESRTLIPGEDGNLPRHGIIIEHHGENEDFEKDFNNYKSQIEKLAKKLDSKTTIYEYSFKTEFSNKDKWVLFENHYVAYNLSL